MSHNNGIERLLHVIISASQVTRWSVNNMKSAWTTKNVILSYIAKKILTAQCWKDFFRKSNPFYRVQAPSTLRTVPLMYLASSEARKAKAAAISSGSPKRPAGTLIRILSCNTC